MTTPKRAKARRYYLALGGDGIVGAGHTAEQASEWAVSDHRIIEVAPVPRVRVKNTGGTQPEWSVYVNGFCVRWFGVLGFANDYARDLRRALKGGE